ncbi:MAG: hypothetical protein B6D45_06815, partial [Ignavibacteriales bacterium UTCHB3]
ASSNFTWHTAGPDSYFVRYELKTEGSSTAWGNLIRVLDTLNNGTNSYESLTEQINTDALFKAIATDLLFGNLDSYSNSGRNFYFYFNTATSKMEWIIWDVGLSFGGYFGGIANYENLSITYLLSQAQRPLMAKMYQNPQLKTEYLNTLCYLFKDNFTPEKLGAKIDSLASVIRPFVYADSRKQFSNTQFEMNLFSDLQVPNIGGGARIPGLKSFITQRAQSVRTQLNNLGIFCVLPAESGELVINEFMADHDTIPDPDGETDDWIEIYNTTNRTIDLSGMYLSDKMTQPTKWQFPQGTTIEPDGYLIVWADEDSTQAGLHANFKLSASGESILLSNVDLSVLDSVTFGAQTTNLAMARMPNGTGEFRQQPPTPGYNNELPSAVLSTTELPGTFRIRQNYPNPFNPLTKVDFSLPNTGWVVVSLYDITGALVATLLNGEMIGGEHSVTVNGNNLHSGVYFLKITQGKNTGVIKMTLLK